MLTLYYKIWADAIISEKLKKGREANWKFFVMAGMSILQGINLLTILLLIRLITKRTLIIFPLHLFSHVGLNTFCAVLFTYFIPFVIINYLLIFSNKQYDQLQKYGDSKGKLYRNYALISIGIIAIPLLIRWIYFS